MEATAIRAALATATSPTVGFSQIGQRGRELLGSGVLVAAGEFRAILTARAVLERLPRMGRLGLVVRTDLNQLSLDTAELSYRTAGRGLGLVVLSREAARRVAAYKQPVTLSGEAKHHASAAAWWVSGFTSELTTTDLPVDCFDIVRGYTNVTAAHTGPIVTDELGDIELTVSRQSDQSKPMSFDGLVGGGLWRVEQRHETISAVFHGVVVDAPSGWSRSGTVRCVGPAALSEVFETLVSAS
jgi:hypothetical protein